MKRDEGHVRAYMRDGTSFCLAPDQYEAVRDSWQHGVAFLNVKGVYGEEVSIKMAEVNGISLLTAEMIEQAKEDEASESLPWST